MIKSKTYITIDDMFNVISVSDELESVVFLADGAILSDGGTYPDIYNEWELYKGKLKTTITREGDKCTIEQHGIPLYDMDIRDAIEKYLKIAMVSPSYYLYSINGESYSTSRYDMIATILGPPKNEKTILMSEGEIDNNRDKRISLIG